MKSYNDKENCLIALILVHVQIKYIWFLQWSFAFILYN